MSEYIRNNPVMRSIEERRKQDEEVALRAEDLKLVKPLVGTLKDETELEVALQQIIYNLCDNVKSYNREMRSCVAKLRESGPGYFFILTKEMLYGYLLHPMWLHRTRMHLVFGATTNLAAM